jgi:hypothetical protein
MGFRNEGVDKLKRLRVLERDSVGGCMAAWRYAPVHNNKRGWPKTESRGHGGKTANG